MKHLQKISILLTGFTFFYVSSSSMVLAAPSPINGTCGSIHNTSISQFPVAGGSTTALCSNGEVTNFVNGGTNVLRTLTWTCEGIYGGSNSNCSAFGDTNVFNTMQAGNGCGIANNQSFVSNAVNFNSVAYSNNNNQFLGTLCNGGAAPLDFSEAPLGRNWTCPGTYSAGIFTNNTSCHADFYYDAKCGIAAGTGQASQPTTNLCAPGSVATMVRYNTETNLWEWECEGGGNGAIAMCNARATSTVGVSPMCNPYVINSPTGTITQNFVNGFPAQNLCGIGYLSDWAVNTVSSIATWKCEFGNQTTPTCGGVFVNGFAQNPGASCNGIVNGQTFEGLSDIDALGFCNNDAIPQDFEDLTNKWEWSCGNQNCEAFKNTTTTMCGYAINQPSLTPPTQGLCAQGQVVSQVYKYANTWKWVCSDIQNGGFCNNSGCQLNYPNQAAICEAPRIVLGSCKWQTLVNPNGFHTPNEVIQSGLCEDGYPDTLIPVQDFAARRWAWTCRGTPNIGSDSPVCHARAGIPNLEIQYSVPRPLPFPSPLSTNQLYNGYVTAHIDGYDPLYLTFTTPFHQDHRLFTENGYFLFQYQDWAGNTGSKMVFVDWIKPQGTNAFAVYSKTTPTSGYVDVKLSGYDSAQNPTTFAGPCLVNNRCTIRVGAHPNDLTIRFTENDEGTFTVNDGNGHIQTILVNVDNIDNVIPTANLYYSQTTPTRDNVVVEIISPSEPITVTNNGGHLSYTFTQNGSFTFNFIDAAGNQNSLTATVSWINKNAPTAKVHYSTTGETNQNVIATLYDFSESGVVVVNNDGSNSFTFTHNGEFIFLLEGATGVRGSVRAYVDWINKPILAGIIEQYESDMCHRMTHRTPVDIAGNEEQLYIATVINNCIAKPFKGTDNLYRFYPRKYITRGEFFRWVGRLIKVTTDYNDTLLENVSDEFVDILAEGPYKIDITEADAWGLLFYTPLIQDGVVKKIDFNASMPRREAKYVMQKALEIMNVDPMVANRLILEDGLATRAEMSRVFSEILFNYDGIAIGNNLKLMKAIEYRLQSVSDYRQQRLFLTKFLMRISKIPDPTLKRFGLHPAVLKEDLVAIIRSDVPKKRKKIFIDIHTVIDDYINEFSDPHNNEVFNDSDAYQYNMFE